MANNKVFKVKNGLQAGRYLLSNGTETVGSEGYGLANASYDGVSFSFVAQDSAPISIFFKPDGNTLYILGYSTDTVYQYSLSTSWDISTASYASKSFSVTQDASPYQIFFKPDGTKMYMVGTTGDAVYQYSLSTAWDISTASYDSVSFSVSAQETVPTGLSFKSDGTKMYVGGQATDAVYQYSLSSAWDISTASYDSVSYSYTAAETGNRNIVIVNNGNSLYTVGASTDTIYEHTLSTSWDLSTASYSGNSFSVFAQDTNPTGLFYKDGGMVLYVLGITNDTVYQYSTLLYAPTLDLSTGTTFAFTPSGSTTVSFTNPPASGLACAFTVEINGDGSTITWPASVKWHEATAPTATATKEIYTFITTDGGTTYYGKQAATELA